LIAFTTACPKSQNSIYGTHMPLGVKDFSQSSGMQSAIANAANSAQNCPKLPKFVQRRNFEIPPKIEILVFLKNKNFYV
jgi:hypothetical protein